MIYIHIPKRSQLSFFYQPLITHESPKHSVNKIFAGEVLTSFMESRRLVLLGHLEGQKEREGELMPEIRKRLNGMDGRFSCTEGYPTYSIFGVFDLKISFMAFLAASVQY